MPIPAYIMFASSGAVDQHTNRTSLFDVVEVLQVYVNNPDAERPTPHSPPAPLRITVAWLRDESDRPDEVFEGQIACTGPDGVALFESEVTPTDFRMLFRRFDIPYAQLPGFNALGIHRIEGRLRRAGEHEWQWRQSFPFIVQLIPPPAPTAPQLAPATE